MIKNKRLVRAPDLAEIMEMARLLEEFGDNTVDLSEEQAESRAAEIEQKIILFFDRIQGEAGKLAGRNRLAFGDQMVLGSALKWLRGSLRSLLDVGEELSPNQRVRYLTRMCLTIMAIYNVGGFTRVTKTTHMVAAAASGRHAGKKKLEKIQPAIQHRRLNKNLPRSLGWKDRETKINEQLVARGIKRVDRRTLQRDLKSS